jgi:hypothetical protein
VKQGRARELGCPILFDVRRTKLSAQEDPVVTPPAPTSVPTPRPRLRPRVKRGIVASYVHGLSRRHRAAREAFRNDRARDDLEWRSPEGA